MTLTPLLALFAVLAPVPPAPQVSASAPPSSSNVDKATRTATVETLIKEMNERYVLPDAAKTIEGSLRKWMSEESFASLDDPLAFSAKVNEILKSGATDAHLRFRYSASSLPKRERPTEPSSDELRRYAEQTRYANANFEKVERLPGNVGYVRFGGFADPKDMERPLEGAMRFLANADAFIVDLRGNGGGDPAGVRLFCSYFFEAKPVHLNDIFFRNGAKVEKQEFWTLKKVAGPRFPNAPLFVLTSKRTGSGAEECAYNFQQLKRGTIIGEPTWGGANPGGMVRLGDHFACFIPVGRAQNPYTKTNWEGTGVLPDVKADPTTSLKDAHVMALKKLIADSKDAERKRLLEQVLEETVKGA
ncbi:MAG: S41 family peptidase [Armatimonadetes bacterium]|nr:S41 family peptidase [Armatimonadota bacterium]